MFTELLRNVGATPRPWRARAERARRSRRVCAALALARFDMGANLSNIDQAGASALARRQLELEQHADVARARPAHRLSLARRGDAAQRQLHADPVRYLIDCTTHAAPIADGRGASEIIGWALTVFLAGVVCAWFPSASPPTHEE